MADTPTPPIPFTCAWAQAGLANALNGLGVASAGVSEYHIGTRGLHYHEAGNQLKTVDWWSKMVELFCGTTPLPGAVTGRESACRIIPRDV
jgi:hypothetical protein